MSIVHLSDVSLSTPRLKKSGRSPKQIERETIAAPLWTCNNSIGVEDTPIQKNVAYHYPA